MCRFVIRVDASLQIGTGHVMRCLSLAAGLDARQAHVQFICREHEGNLIDLIEERGFEVVVLPKSVIHVDDMSTDNPHYAHWLGCHWKTDANQCRDLLKDPVDWIIVDHYALDYRWERVLRDKCNRLMCIDDLADRTHDCDLLLDQCLGRKVGDYSERIPDHAQQLFGPKFALLRPEFEKWRTASLVRRKDPQLRHILVAMGGVDNKNVSGRILTSLQGCNLPKLEKITVVLGQYAPWSEQVKTQASEMTINVQVLLGVDNMAELMTSSDLVIGAGGSTTWERCSLGVPSVLINLAENQRNTAHYMLKADAAFVIDNVSGIDLLLPRFLKSGTVLEHLKTYAQASSRLADGTGVSKVIEQIGL